MVRFEEVDACDLLDWLTIYNTKPLSTREIKVHDDTLFSEYRAEVMEVLRIDEDEDDVAPVRVIWNLLDLTRLPYEHFYPQIRLMCELKSVIWTRLLDSCILVRNNAGLVSFLRMLFSVYTPQRPVIVVAVKGDVNKMLKGEVTQMRDKSVGNLESIWF